MTETRLIHGFHAITSKLRHAADDIKEITVAEGRQDGRMRDLLKLAEAQGVRVIASDAKRLDGLAGVTQHQGVVAEVEPVPLLVIEELVALWKKQDEKALAKVRGLSGELAPPLSQNDKVFFIDAFKYGLSDLKFTVSEEYRYHELDNFTSFTE